jgi:oligopeptide/dipeptide ABC transporter ATP-binding protein
VLLQRDVLDLFPHQLTASEQQRAGIARAIVTHPDLIVIDEATSSLDPTVRSLILRLLMDLQERLGVAYVFISHDLTAVEQISHRVAIMYLGRIAELASTEELVSRQLHPYSRALLSAVLHADPGHRLEPFMLTGEIPSPIDPPDECALAGRCPFVEPRCRASEPRLEELLPGHLTACYRASEFVAHGVPSLQASASGHQPTGHPIDQRPAVGAGSGGGKGIG